MIPESWVKASFRLLQVSILHREKLKGLLYLLSRLHMHSVSVRIQISIQLIQRWSFHVNDKTVIFHHVHDTRGKTRKIKYIVVCHKKEFSSLINFKVAISQSLGVIAQEQVTTRSSHFQSVKFEDCSFCTCSIFNYLVHESVPVTSLPDHNREVSTVQRLWRLSVSMSQSLLRPADKRKGCIAATSIATVFCQKKSIQGRKALVSSLKGNNALQLLSVSEDCSFCTCSILYMKVYQSTRPQPKG